MSEVRFGVTLPQFTDDPTRMIEGARRAEELGLDSIWVFDHLWPLTGGKNRPALEAWTSIAYLLAATDRITIGSLVTRSSLRHPAVLAKIVATVAAVAPGRLIVGIGSGDQKSRDENEAFGFPYWAEDDRIDQFRSSVEVLYRSLNQDRVTVHDDYVSVTDLPPSPRLSSRPPLWVAGRSDDALQVAADLGDGWNGWGGTPERFAEDAGTVLEMAKGRLIEPTWGGLIVLAGSDEDARAAAPPAGTALVGGPPSLALQLSAFVDGGAKHVIATFAGVWRTETLELFASEVVPLVRSS